ncbi:hypothetical protein IAD21_01732 [Abditibacteriota bacterium]|nr:hypothetical protein IAD21_01732 [Abditibacteriota bacterium]
MTSPKTSRFHFLDAMRGVAAAAVVLHHLFFSSVMVTVYQAVSPFFVRVLFQAGAHGVEIFFVLSGFVIAHSLRNNPLSLASLGQFILRRQVRLDPPYWAALVLGLGSLWLRNHLPGVVREPLPSPRELVLNATYLHELFRLPKSAIVLEVAWTLCLEIQFYLLFIVILWLCHDTPRPQQPYSSEEDSPPIANRAIVAMWVSGVACLVVRHFVVDAAYFWTAWHYFVAGTLAYWAVSRKTNGFWIASFLGAFVVSWGASWLSHPIHRGPYMNSANPLALFVGAATALALWQLGIRGQLGIWNNVRPLQYLGRISYSLYLTHLMVVLMVLRLGYKITKNNVPAAFVWMVVCGAVCVLVAHAFYLLIERPSLRWASAISKREPAMTRFTPDRTIKREP